VHSAKREVTLSGEVVRSIPTVRSYVNQVDWRQLRQWGIDEGRVPAGTIVRFRDPTTWDRYRAYILGALAVLLMQTALIAGLLIQRARRQRAENELRKSQAALQSSYERIRDLGGRLLKAQETERSRIARELHDDISQQASLLAIDLALIRRRQDQTNTLTDEALNKAEGIVKSVHDLSHRLHPAKLRLIGLVPALRDLQRELSHADVPITFTDDNVPAILPHDVTLCLFRIVQEGLQNAIKYSQAHRISVRLAGGPRELTLTIEDDGVGFDIDSAWGQGLGLISMGERVEVFGGNFHVRSAPGAGTRIEATVPLHVVEDRDFVAV
jgi:signal transduction histidine kinase